MSGLGAALRDIAARLDAAGAPWAVFGGLATRFYGSCRPLRDIDLVARAEDETFAAAAADAAPLPYGAFGVGSAEAYRSPLVFATDEGTFAFHLDDDALARRRSTTVEGQEAHLLAPEDVLVIKALLQRPPSDGKHDDADAATILAAQGGRLDWSYLRTRAQRCGGRARVETWLERHGGPT